MKPWELFCQLILLAVIFCGALGLDDDDNEDDHKSQDGAKMFNFASHAAGAVVLDKSPASAKGFSNLLVDDKDKYGISPCNEKKWVVIGLSEDIMITSVVIANYERYSSMLKDFQLYASNSYPASEWIDLGVYTAEPKLGEQMFNITSTSSAHTRYLKIKFKTHYDNDALCTLSQVKVHGMTVIASFKQEVEWSDTERRDMLQQLSNEIKFDEEEEVKEPEPVNQTEASSANAVATVSSECGVDPPPEVQSADNTAVCKTSENVSSPDSVSVDAGQKSTDEAATVTANDEIVVVESQNDNASQEENQTIPDGVVIDGSAAADVVNGSEALSNSSGASSGSNGLNIVTGFIQSLMNLATPPHSDKVEAEAEEVIVDSDYYVEVIDEEVLEGEKEQGEDTPVNETVTEKDTEEQTLPSEGVSRESVSVEVSRNESMSTEDDPLVSVDATVDQDAPAVDAVSVVPVNKDTSVPDVVLNDPANVTVAVEDSMTVAAADAENKSNATLSESVESASVESDAVLAESPAVVESLANSSTVLNDTVVVVVDVASVGVNTSTPLEPASNSTVSSSDNESAAVGASDAGAAANVTAAPEVTVALSDNTTTSSSTPSSPKSTSTASASTPSASTIASVSISMAGGATPLLNCYETLKLADFQAKMIAKLQKSNSSMFDVDSSIPTTTSKNSDTSNNNVFRILMQRIKALELNNAIMDMYIIQLTECYRTVTKEIMSSKILLDNMDDAKAHMAVVERLQEASLMRQNTSQELVTTRQALMMQRRNRVNSGGELIGEEYFTLVGILGLWLSCLLGAADVSLVSEITEVYVDENRVFLLVGAFLLSFGSVVASVGVCCWFYYLSLKKITLGGGGSGQWSTGRK